MVEYISTLATPDYLGKAAAKSMAARRAGA